MSKGRLDKLAEAIKRLQKRQVKHHVYSDKALPLEYRTVAGGAKVSMYRMPDDEALRMSDHLLGLGGAGMLANREPIIPGWETPEEKAEREQDLIDAGFVRADDSRWVMPMPEAEIAFLQGWLAEADRGGREVQYRSAIESWIRSLGGKAVGRELPPVPPDNQYIPTQDEVIARRAHQQGDEEMDAWRRAVRSGKPKQDEELREANIRRTTRRPRRR